MLRDRLAALRVHSIDAYTERHERFSVARATPCSLPGAPGLLEHSRQSTLRPTPGSDGTRDFVADLPNGEADHWMPAAHTWTYLRTHALYGER